MNNKTRDFVLAVVTLLFGCYITSEGLKIYKIATVKPYKITQFALSPGMLPTVLGLLLIFFSLLLIFFSLREKDKTVGKALKDHMVSFCTSMKNGIFDKNVHRMVIGMIIMAIFSFFLVGLRIGNFMLPFYISGAIFMFALLMYLGAVKWWQALIITVATMIVIQVLFVYGFRAILP